ncbi:hypothetical protein LTS02_017030 [Friedmanniomyces endolithicus]|nr:hypothetical protein LTS02_017030 [Friedmanniomyces endolithicus]
MANPKPTTCTTRLQKQAPTRMSPTTPTNETPTMTLPPPAYHDGRPRAPIDDNDTTISLPCYHSSTLFPHYNPDDKHTPATTTSRASMEVHADVHVDLEAQRAGPAARGVLVQQQQQQQKVPTPAKVFVIVQCAAFLFVPLFLGGFFWVVLGTH